MTTPFTPGQLSAWELGDLRAVSPSLIVRDEDDVVGRLILCLALAFNDLKGMILLDRYRLAFAQPGAEEVSAHAGQLGGLLIQVHRFIGGIVNEALTAIKTESAVIDSAEMTGLLASLPPAVQELWRDIIAEARNSPQGTNRTNRAMLARLRNKSSFHYDGEKLSEAFHGFFAGTPTKYNASAYYSVGIDMDGTRYFFADAAAQTDYMNAGKERGRQTDAEVAKLAGDLNTAFAFLISAFLAERATTPTPTVKNDERKAAPVSTSPHRLAKPQPGGGQKKQIKGKRGAKVRRVGGGGG